MGMPFPLILGICIVNGIFSPFLNIAVPISSVLMPEAFPRSAGWVLFFSSLLVSSATLFASGIPAALYERIVDDNPQSRVSMYIWLAGCLALSLPALQTLKII